MSFLWKLTLCFVCHSELYLLMRLLHTSEIFYFANNFWTIFIYIVKVFMIWSKKNKTNTYIIAPDVDFAWMESVLYNKQYSGKTHIIAFEVDLIGRL